MLKLIRPAGFVAFVIIALLLLLFWFFAAGWIVKTAVEEGGSRVLGAKVELDEAAVSFSPFGVTLNQLQLTNPDNPMENMFQAKQLRATVSLPELLMGNVVVDELSGQGVQFAVARHTSGALEKRVEAEPPKETSTEFDMPSMGSMPSADEVLEREPLTTLTLSDAFSGDLERHKTAVDTAVDGLPDDARLQQYKTRIAAIKNEKINSLDDLNKQKQALDEIKQSIRLDKQALDDAKEAIAQAKLQLGDGLSKLKTAPGDDWDKIKSKYSFSPENLANFSRLLFGDKVGYWVESIQPWIGQIERNLGAQESAKEVAPPRGEGRFIHFSKQGRTPSFLIRTAQLSVGQAGGSAEITAKNITHEPEILGQPMVFDVHGEKLAAIERLSAKGVVDFRDANQPMASMNWRLSNWQLADLALSESENLGLALGQAQVQMHGEVQFLEKGLAGESRGQFQNVSWSGKGDQGSSVANAMKSIDHFNIDVGVSGAVRSPNISIQSDLDKHLKSVLSGRFKERQAVLEKELKSRLQQRISVVSEPYNQYRAEWDQQQARIKERISLLESMLSEEIKSGVEAEKQTAKDRLKSKLKGLGR